MLLATAREGQRRPSAAEAADLLRGAVLALLHPARDRTIASVAG